MPGSCDLTISPNTIPTATEDTVEVQEPGGERGGEPWGNPGQKAGEQPLVENPGEQRRLVEKAGEQPLVEKIGEQRRLVEKPGEQRRLVEKAGEQPLVEKAGEQVEKPGEQPLVEKPGEQRRLVEKPGEQPYGETGQERVQPDRKKNRAEPEPIGVGSTIGDKFSLLLLWMKSFFSLLYSCCLFSHHRTPAAPDDVIEEYGEEQRLLHRKFGLAPYVHAESVKMKNRAGISGDVDSSIGDEFEADPVDSLAAVSSHPPERVTDTVIDVAEVETTTVNLGGSENPIEVGELSLSDYELILEVCPSLG